MQKATQKIPPKMSKSSKIVLSISLLGTLIILFLSTLPQSATSIANITSSASKALIHANILYQKNYSSYSYLMLKDPTGNISAICFGCPVFNKSKTYAFSGTITTYQNTLQMQINSAKPIN